MPLLTLICFVFFLSYYIVYETNYSACENNLRSAKWEKIFRVNIYVLSDEYWSQHPEMHDIPIYYASSLAKKCMAVYQTYINAMNDRIRRQIAINNPFVFKHISNLKVSNCFTVLYSIAIPQYAIH